MFAIGGILNVITQRVDVISAITQVQISIVAEAVLVNFLLGKFPPFQH